jgi:hypothetical protein
VRSGGTAAKKVTRECEIDGGHGNSFDIERGKCMIAHRLMSAHRD